ncbi:ciliary microtubule inner protein 2B isoform X2 [Equus caballus]|uniref:ciliary microtubule inner protein 2B isoform X2 n=1 Tax=Equus caballus TaxID=9796 RepID=UPI000717C4DC|nr:protein FAM166B isoform X2 [Equus caballus]
MFVLSSQVAGLCSGVDRLASLCSPVLLQVALAVISLAPPSLLLPRPRLLPLARPCSPGHSTHSTEPSAQRQTKGTAWVPGTMASIFTLGLNPQHPHHIPGYTGHCPLFRFSMGQAYGQITGHLLRGSPGLAWPPAHRTLLPPIWPPRSPEVPRRRSLRVRHGHKRLSSSMIPGYTGFVPQAQFIFAKNCSQVWAEALHHFTQWHGGQGSQEQLPKEAKGEKDMGKEPTLEPELEAKEEPQLGEKVEQVRPRKLRGLQLPPTPRMTEILASSSCQALPEFGQMYSWGRPQKDPKHLLPLSMTFPQNLGLLPNYGGSVPRCKFQFGHTSWHLTHDALGLSTLQRQLLV